MNDSTNFVDNNISSNSRSFFANVSQAPIDPIYDVVEIKKLSAGKERINLGVGAYRTDEGVPYIFSTVTKAENIILQNQDIYNKEYLGLEGYLPFVKAAQQINFGKDSPV